MHEINRQRDSCRFKFNNTTKNRNILTLYLRGLFFKQLKAVFNTISCSLCKGKADKPEWHCLERIRSWALRLVSISATTLQSPTLPKLFFKELFWPSLRYILYSKHCQYQAHSSMVSVSVCGYISLSALPSRTFTSS